MSETGRSRAITALALCLVLSLPTKTMADPPGDCAARLDRTLEEMESRPLLKEELATGLMWIRLDAQTALEDGNERKCLSRVQTAEQILGLNAPKR